MDHESVSAVLALQEYILLVCLIIGRSAAGLGIFSHIAGGKVAHHVCAHKVIVLYGNGALGREGKTSDLFEGGGGSYVVRTRFLHYVQLVGKFFPGSVGELDSEGGEAKIRPRRIDAIREADGIGLHFHGADPLAVRLR